MTAHGLEPINSSARETLTTEISRRLLKYLLSGTIQPGERVPSERQLAEMLAVGRSVVRKSLKSVALLGLLEVRPGDGTYLRRTQSELLPKTIEWGLLLGERRTLDLVEARRYLEPILAALAAERRSDSDIEALRTDLQDMANARDAMEFANADIAFHLGLAAAANNSALSEMLSSVRSLLRVWIVRVMEAAEDFGPSHREHVPVFEAVERGDAAGARAAMEVHLARASERLVATLTPEEAGHVGAGR